MADDCAVRPAEIIAEPKQSETAVRLLPANESGYIGLCLTPVFERSACHDRSLLLTRFLRARVPYRAGGGGG